MIKVKAKRAYVRLLSPAAIWDVPLYAYGAGKLVIDLSDHVMIFLLFHLRNV